MAVKRVKKTYHDIRFSFCPIDKHKGEMWEKIKDRDLDEPCEIVDISYEWVDSLAIGFWRSDTFSDFTWDDVHKLMAMFNKGITNVPGIILTLDHIDGEFTTFRTWSPSKDNYYQTLMSDCERLTIRTPLNPKVI